jgi:hypothetical protein
MNSNISIDISGICTILEIDDGFSSNCTQYYDTKTNLSYRTFGLLYRGVPFLVKSSHLRMQLIHKFNLIN